MSNNTDNGKKHLCEKMSFAVHEAFKRLRTNTLLVLPQNDRCKVLGITSAQPGEGKSTSAINLAYSFSELGKRVLLIDADLHRPSIAAKLGLTGKIGLGDLLNVNNDISSAIVQYRSHTGSISFDIIGAETTENSSELLSSPRLSNMLNVLSEAYEIIVVDLPPVDAVIDAVIVGKNTDGVIIIARENETLKKQFDNCIKQLELAQIKLLGIVFNGSLEGKNGKYQYRGSY